jgi:hypothetical protein
MLRFLDTVTAGVFSLRQASFPPGEDPIHITNLTCTGHEGSLLDCPYVSDTTGCTHAMDVDVDCRQEREYNVKIVLIKW